MTKKTKTKTERRLTKKQRAMRFVETDPKAITVTHPKKKGTKP